jgi:low affinity Fe/Cu permease
VNELFRRFSAATANVVGSPWSFIVACLVIVVWGFTGPLFDYSDTWQLVINTGTTIVTFLMVFLIQNTQNRDARAIHLKLDELIKGVEGARNRLVDLEDMDDDELERLQTEFERLRNREERKQVQHAVADAEHAKSDAHHAVTEAEQAGAQARHAESEADQAKVAAERAKGSIENARESSGQGRPAA